MRLGALAIVCFTLFAPSSAHAWDDHQLLTRLTLASLQGSAPQFWQQLNDTTVTVRPIESFFAKAFGAGCTYSRAKDAVLGGVGKDYEVYYTDIVSKRFIIDWEKGSSIQVLRPRQDGHNPQALGSQVKPIDVIAIYVDEPDWNMDDDVPRLKGKGASKDAEGTGTRTLRHFWYEGENVWGVDFGLDQETDQRFQLYYELSLIAFSVDEPYWGYRFLGLALHYVQDLTQPFHDKAIISEEMIDKTSIIRAKLCEWNPGNKECTPDLTIDKLVIKNGWVVGAYHGIYEDFARGLMSPQMRFQTYSVIADWDGSRENAPSIESLVWTNPTKGGVLLDGRELIRSEQRAMLRYASEVGTLAYKAFGWTYRFDEHKAREAIDAGGTEKAIGYQIGTLFGFPGIDLGLSARQESAVLPLVQTTHKVLERAGIWGRKLVRTVLEQSTDKRALVAIARRRAQLRKKCAPMSSYRTPFSFR